MRVALVHDWLTGMRGGERVLHQLAMRFPGADLYTLVHVPGTTTPEIDALSIHVSPLDRIPGIARHYRKLLPLFPWAIDQLELGDCDVVISTSHAVAKCVRSGPSAVHVSYCLTPMRYVWDQIDAYLGTGARRRIADPLVRSLRRFDRGRSDPDHVDRFVAISSAVRERIREHYGRDAAVVHPPVEIERIAPGRGPREDFYLLVGGFVPYKREELAIQAFARLDRPLVVVGDGPTRARVVRDLPANVRYLGRVSDAELAGLYGRCRALVYPQEEDFGIVAVEAQAAGRPVIAYGAGGALDTVRPLLRVDADGVRHEAEPDDATGVLFTPQTAEGLAAAVRAFEQVERRFDPLRIRQHAEHFAAPRFIAEIEREIALALGGSATETPAAPAPRVSGWRRIEPTRQPSPRPSTAPRSR